MGKKKPVRVAQIMGKLWAGGVEMVVFNYYREIDKNEVQFDFYYDADSTVTPPQELIDMGAEFYEIPPYQDLFNYLKTLKKHFREKKYSIVHSHINTLSVFPLFMAWLCRIPVRIAHNHSVPGGNEWKRNTLKKFLKIFSKIFATDYFACSEVAGRWMFGKSSFDKNKVFVLKNAVDFNKLNCDVSDICNINVSDKFVVGHVGRFTYAKNHQFLLNVFSEIRKKRDDAILILVGDGELHNEIEKTIKQLNLENSVIMTGQVSDPEKYYSLFDVLVLPSHFEGLSLATVEAQIAGVPAVISDAVPQEAVISNACNYMKLSDSAEQWAQAAIQMADTNVELNDKSEAYNISESAPILVKWYQNKEKEILR